MARQRIKTTFMVYSTYENTIKSSDFAFKSLPIEEKCKILKREIASCNLNQVINKSKKAPKAYYILFGEKYYIKDTEIAEYKNHGTIILFE